MDIFAKQQWHCPPYAEALLEVLTRPSCFVCHMACADPPITLWLLIDSCRSGKPTAHPQGSGACMAHFAQRIWARADVKSNRAQHTLSAAGHTQPHCPQQLAQVLEVPTPPRADLFTNTFAANQPAGMAS